MPISSFHGLRKNSVQKPWTSTRSAQRGLNSPRNGSGGTYSPRKKSLGSPRIYGRELEYGDVPFLPENGEERLAATKKLKNRLRSSSSVEDERRVNGRTTPRSTECSRPRSARYERPLTRRDTFPKFDNVTGAKRPVREYKRSKTDPLINLEKAGKVKENIRYPRRPTTLWTGKRQVKTTSKSRGNKVNNGVSSPLCLSPEGTLKRLNPGERVVCILNKKPQLGILKYVGTTHFADGEWCGIFLDECCGKNDGSVRGVRYFRCKNKHGIFVHSHKVRTADETTLSKLNLLESPCYSPLPEKQDKKLTRSEGKMDLSHVETPSPRVIDEGKTVFVCRDRRVLKARNLTRGRSVSLDRYLFLKAKQLAKGFNIFLHSGKGDKTDTCDSENRLNRSISLPKMINTQDPNIETMEYCRASEKISVGKNVLQMEREFSGVFNAVSVLNGNGDHDIDNKSELFSNDVNNTNTCKGELLFSFSENMSEDRLHSLNGMANHDYNNYSNGDSSVKKVGHAFSLDTHLRVKNGQLAGVQVDSDKEEFTCQQNESDKEDAFVQGRHCSCPALHSADHFSKAITTCIDLGRAERSRTTSPEPIKGDESNSGNAHVTCSVEGIPCEDGKNSLAKHSVEHMPSGFSHSQSEVLDKIFRTKEDFVGKSSSSKAVSLTRVSSWPQLLLSSKKPLKSHGSSGDIGSHGSSFSKLSSWRNIGESVDDDVFDGGLTLISDPKMPISIVSERDCHSNHSAESVPRAVDITLVGQERPQSLPAEPNERATDTDLSNAGSLSGSQASLSSTGTSDSKGKKMSAAKRTPSVTKRSASRPRSLIGVSSGTGPRASQQKQSKPEQIRQMNGRAPSSTSNKGKVNNKVVGSVTSKSDIKMNKRHTLATIPDVKSYVPLPRPSLVKRPMSSGVVELTGQSTKEGVKSSKLPIKRVTTPSQASKPAATSKVEKEPPRAPIQRRHSAAASRPPIAPGAKRSSALTSSEQKTREASTPASAPTKSAVKGKGVEQKTGSAQTPVGLKGAKAAIATVSRTQSSRVVRSSSSVTAKGQASRETKTQPPSTSSRTTPQTVKQNARPGSGSQRHSASKLPRKVSAQSTASDSVSVTSSNKDHSEELDDGISVSTETSDQDGALRHFQRDSHTIDDVTPSISDQVDACQKHEHDRKSPAEMPPRALPPDILSETPCLSRHSVGIQVEYEGHLEAIQALQEKGKHLHEVLRQRTDLCGQLQGKIEDNDVDILGASLVIVSVVKKLKWSHKYTNQLQRKIETTLQEMKQVQERLVEEEGNNIKLQEEMMYQSSEHAVAMETLKADYDNILDQTSADLKNKHSGEITLAIETHKSHVHDIKQHHEKELTQLKHAYEESVKVLKEDHRDEIAELESGHSSAIEELVEEHHVEIETIKTENDELQSDLKEKHDKLASECGSLNKKLQQLQEENLRDVEIRVQEAIKEYITLPAELESIKAVLEMRNAEIKQLRKEKMEKHLELEELKEFNSQMQKLRHENESLSFVVENKSKFERQLSVERDSLRNSLEKEAKKSKRLSLENEELQWRLCNSSSPLASPSEESFSLSMPNRNSFHLSTNSPDPLRPIDE